MFQQSPISTRSSFLALAGALAYFGCSGPAVDDGLGGEASTGSGGAASGGVGTGSGGVGVNPTGTGGSSTVPVDCSAIAAHEGWELCESGNDFCTAVFTDGAGCDAVCAAAGLGCGEVWENADGSCAANTTIAQLSCGTAAAHQSDFCRCAGASSASGGAAGSGGAGSGGSAGSGGGTGVVGNLSISDAVPGFASVAGGTTGGGKNLAAAVSVSNITDLKAAVSGNTAKIILVQPGTYSGTLSVGANKTILGVGPGVKINGNISISGADRNNIIIRNLAVQGLPCASYDECRAGADAVYIGNGAHHVWLDHLDISDGQDGNCDVTQGGDYVTVSWTHFHYTYAKEHRFSNLIAGSDDEPNSVGKLRITYMDCHWGERVDTRQPRGRFGNVHMLNNYHNTGGGQIHGVGKDMALIAENSVYDEDRSIWTDMGSPRGWKGTGNIGTGDNLNQTNGSVFTIPYSYTALPASQVKAAVTSPDCGAGNNCTLSQ